MYTALDLSKYIVKKCIDDGHPINNLQLQKILYYIQKDFLSRGDLAFLDDIEAWQFGPVVPNVYYHYCGYGVMPITFVNGSAEISDYDIGILNPIIEVKRALNPWDMVAETQKPDGAWAQVYKNGEGNRHVIPTDLIRKVG